MRSGNRRTATRVRDGAVQKKNNWAPDHADYMARSQSEVRIDRRSPGQGYRHLITVAHLRVLLELLPDWEDAAAGLDAVVLDSGQDRMGWCDTGVVAICAWEQELWWEDCSVAFYQEHRVVLDKFEVERSKVGPDRIQVRWTEDQARAFQLLHVLPHEIGHHRDRMTTRSQRRIARGEPYAERYALRVMDEVWPLYTRHFAI